MSNAMRITAQQLTQTAFALASVAVFGTGPAAAGGDAVFGERYIGPMAELSIEEQAWFRNNWQQMSPQEREAVRRQFRQEWRETPPEQRHKHREEWLGGIGASGANAGAAMRAPTKRGHGWGAPEGGYGQGYENRQWTGYPDNGSGGTGRGRR